MKYYIKTFGCQQNTADSERIEQAFLARNFTKAKSYRDANYVIINTCMVRKSAENRVYGLVENLKKIKKQKKQTFKIIVTGCMTGLALRDKTGKYLKRLKTILPDVDEFMPIEEVGFDNEPIRQNITHALVPISNGCNNFCTYCVVPNTRGPEISRPMDEIIKECKELKSRGYRIVTLLGQNVNSYGADLILDKNTIGVENDDKSLLPGGRLVPRSSKSEVGMDSWDGGTIQTKESITKLQPVYVKHLGKNRIPTLFPHLLNEVARLGFETVEFMSSNPWDFSDELIEVIKTNSNITRTIHLPVQSGDSNVLKRMNRWYSRDEYLDLIYKLQTQIPAIKITTDIIVGFCGETEEEFAMTLDLCKKVNFEKAYIAMYSPRPLTLATKNLIDDVPHKIKKHRWEILDALINKPKLKKKN